MIGFVDCWLVKVSSLCLCAINLPKYRQSMQITLLKIIQKYTKIIQIYTIKKRNLL